MSEHTPGPLHVMRGLGAGHQDELWLTTVEGGVVFAAWPFDDDDVGERTKQANTDRLKALWSACESIPTEALDADIVREMVAVLEATRNEIDADMACLFCTLESFHVLDCPAPQIAALLSRLRGEAVS